MKEVNVGDNKVSTNESLPPKYAWHSFKSSQRLIFEDVFLKLEWEENYLTRA